MKTRSIPMVLAAPVAKIKLHGLSVRKLKKMSLRRFKKVAVFCPKSAIGVKPCWLATTYTTCGRWFTDVYRNEVGHFTYKDWCWDAPTADELAHWDDSIPF